MKFFFYKYTPSLEEWLVLGGGVFVILLVAYLFTRYTKYGGGSNYGMTGEFDNDFDNLDDNLE